MAEREVQGEQARLAAEPEESAARDLRRRHCARGRLPVHRQQLHVIRLPKPRFFINQEGEAEEETILKGMTR